MTGRVFQLVVQYDGTDFSGWQAQPGARTVQGELEAILGRLCGVPVRIAGAGRTDAGVHARGQAAGVELPVHWDTARLRRAINQQAPADIWLPAVHEMQAGFHARFSAISRRYSYGVGIRDDCWSPFRRRYLHVWPDQRGSLRDDGIELLNRCAALVTGTHAFRAFAVRGTAPEGDDHRCTVAECRWVAHDDVWTMHIEANRFLHHMVRFLVGTMLDVASGKRPIGDLSDLLNADRNDDVSPPASASGLTLERVTYPAQLYLTA
ncbi:MAG: tRNA pseudouridine(38-40) synthase TruA [Gemmatimonadetes bacterium]|nr:tRNA pseudouridine(38-40) synthase TruA [Gemmatimonadota bacterium]